MRGSPDNALEVDAHESAVHGTAVEPSRAWHAPKLTVLGRLDSVTTASVQSQPVDEGTCFGTQLAVTCGETLP